MKRRILFPVMCSGLIGLLVGASHGWAQQPASTLSAEKKTSLLSERKIIPGDRLRISVAEQPDLNRVYPVAGDGTIDFGFIGRITIAEKSGGEAAHEIKRLLEETYFKEATVTVDIAEFVEGAILIIGAVQSTGSIPFSGGEILTVMEAISLKGGLTREAAGNQVKILRWKSGAGMAREIITVDVQSMYEDLDFTKDQYLRPRDIVFVPSLGAADSVRSEFLALGEVGTPGFHPYSEGLDVIRAVMRAGGVGKGAKWSSARILRPNKTGQYTIIPIDLSRLFGAADMNMNLPVLAGDILFVPSTEQANRGQAYLLGEVARQGALPLSLDEDMTLAKAILGSGGFAQFANDSKVKILRKAPDGSKQTLVIDVGRILKTGAFEDDVPLENGDVIIVPEKMLGF